MVDVDGDGTGDEELEAEIDPAVEGDEKPIEAQVAKPATVNVKDKGVAIRPRPGDSKWQGTTERSDS